MKLLLIHQFFVSPAEPGGTRHYELASRWIDHGHEATIVASDLTYLTGQKVAGTRGWVSRQMLGKLVVLRAKTLAALHRSFVWRVISFLSFMVTSVIAGLRAGKVDVVMGTSPPLPQGLSAWLVATIRRRPFLLEIRDLWPDFAIEIGVLKNKGIIWLARGLEAFLYARAKHIVVNSPAYREHLIAKRVPAAKISIVANGVDWRLFDPQARGEALRKACDCQDKFLVVYAGAVGMANDLETLLRAMQRLHDLSDVHLAIVGDGKERTHLIELARQMNLINVSFPDAVAKEQMPGVLAAADCCIATLKNIPGFRTTYPNKVFDYMASGRPQVLAIDGAIRAVVEAAEAGVCVMPGDDAAIAQAIRQLFENRSLAQQMGLRGRDYVRRHFDRRAQATRFIRLVESLGNSKQTDVFALDNLELDGGTDSSESSGDEQHRLRLFSA